MRTPVFAFLPAGQAAHVARLFVRDRTLRRDVMLLQDVCIRALAPLGRVVTFFQEGQAGEEGEVYVFVRTPRQDVEGEVVRIVRENPIVTHAKYRPLRAEAGSLWREMIGGRYAAALEREREAAVHGAGPPVGTMTFVRVRLVNLSDDSRIPMPVKGDFFICNKGRVAVPRASLPSEVGMLNMAPCSVSTAHFASMHQGWTCLEFSAESVASSAPIPVVDIHPDEFLGVLWRAA